MAERLLPLRPSTKASSEQARNLCGQVRHGAGGRHLVPGSLQWEGEQQDELLLLQVHKSTFPSSTAR